MKKLSVIIPAYNEAHRIEKTLLSVSEFLKNQPYESEILVVSDGSKDETEAVVSRLVNQIPNLSIIANKENHGKGFVVKQGMLSATGDVRLFMDADNSTKIVEITKFLPFFDSPSNKDSESSAGVINGSGTLDKRLTKEDDQGYGVVIGSRRIQGSVIATHQGFLRDFLGGVFRFIVHTLAPIGVTDSQCGFKAFSSESVQLIFSKQSIFRWAFDVEILALARKQNIKIKEMPIVWVNDGESHVKLGGMINMLLEVIQIRINLWTGKYDK